TPGQAVLPCTEYPRRSCRCVARRPCLGTRPPEARAACRAAPELSGTTRSAYWTSGVRSTAAYLPPFAWHITPLTSSLLQQEAARHMVGGDMVLVRECLAAARLLRRTARGKTAAHWQAGQIGRLPGNGYQLFALHTAMDRGVHQSLRVRVCWLLQDRTYRAVFDNAPGIHDRHLVCHLRSHPNIVGPED